MPFFGKTMETTQERFKYPRTFHLPWSEGRTRDDRIMPNIKGLEDEWVIVTLKMDGENTTLYQDGLHARSLTYESHSSRDMMKSIHAKIAHEIYPGYRICGENVYAKHSIRYTDLVGYFLMFSIWDKEKCLSWKDMLSYNDAFLGGLPTVPIIYEGRFDQKQIEEAFKSYQIAHEGYVIRVAREFNLIEFPFVVGKYVRKDHVHAHGHWMRQAVEPNELRK